MCECLEHADGTITVCSVCSETWREYETVLLPRLRQLEAVREAVRRWSNCPECNITCACQDSVFDAMEACDAEDRTR